MKGSTIRLLDEDLKKCGMGLGAECCIFLTVDKDGFGCEQQSELREQLIANRPQMNAKRMPEERYPACQLSLEESE